MIQFFTHLCKVARNNSIGIKYECCLGLACTMRFIRKIGTRGILTLPVELREVMDIAEGDLVEFELLAVVRKAPQAKPAVASKDALPSGVRA